LQFGKKKGGLEAYPFGKEREKAKGVNCCLFVEGREKGRSMQPEREHPRALQLLPKNASTSEEPANLSGRGRSRASKGGGRSLSYHFSTIRERGKTLS